MANKDPNMMTSTMFSFVGKHLYVSIKVVMIFIILSIFTYAFDLGDWIYFVISGICLLAYIFFDYQDSWNRGVRDNNLVKYKYIKYNKYKGLISGLLSQIPGVIIIILILITLNKPSTYHDIFKLGYLILYAPTAPLVRYFQYSMPILFFLPAFICPIVSTIAYYCGYRNIGILQKMLYNQKNDRSKNKKLR